MHELVHTTLILMKPAMDKVALLHPPPFTAIIIANFSFKEYWSNIVYLIPIRFPYFHLCYPRMSVAMIDFHEILKRKMDNPFYFFTFTLNC